VITFALLNSVLLETEIAMEVSMRFLDDIPRWDEEKPYEIFVESNIQCKKSNVVLVDHSNVKVEDLRGIEHECSLEEEGFEFIKHQFKFRPTAADFESAESSETVVTPFLVETMEVVKAHLHADRIICFDWQVFHKGTSLFAQHTANANEHSFVGICPTKCALIGKIEFAIFHKLRQGLYTSVSGSRDWV
jgi:hypothetical protein